MFINLKYKGSPWRDIISTAILELQEKGDLQVLYRKWWKEEDINPNKKCNTVEVNHGSTSKLSMDSIGGIFIIMAIGMGLSFLVAVFEFIIKARKTSTSKKNFAKNMVQGLRSSTLNFFEEKFKVI